MGDELFIDEPNYIKLCRGLEKRKKIIHISSVNFEELNKICTYAMQNSPTAIGVDGFKFMMMSRTVNILPNYTLGRDSINDLLEKCKERRDKIIAHCRRSSAYESAVAVHDMIARNVEYKDDGDLAHSMAAPLTMKYGVCDGFAKAYKFVMDGLGIPCIVISGKAQNPVTLMK